MNSHPSSLSPLNFIEDDADPGTWWAPRQEDQTNDSSIEMGSIGVRGLQSARRSFARSRRLKRVWVVDSLRAKNPSPVWIGFQLLDRMNEIMGLVSYR